MPLRKPVTLQTFADEFLVVCPRCACRARLQASAVSRPARLTCIEWGTSKFMGAAARGGRVGSDSGRLPRWLKLAKNRTEIVNAIQKLRARHGSRA
jgi:hypothetical protein